MIKVKCEDYNDIEYDFNISLRKDQKKNRVLYIF